MCCRQSGGWPMEKTCAGGDCEPSGSARISASVPVRALAWKVPIMCDHNKQALCASCGPAGGDAIDPHSVVTYRVIHDAALSHRAELQLALLPEVRLDAREERHRS